MARAISSREKRLLVVLAVLVVPALWMLNRDPGTGPTATAAAKAAGSGKAARLAQAPVVRLDALSRSASDVDGDARDLFKYGQRPPSAREVARLRAEAERQRRLEEEARRQQEEAAKRAAEEAAKRAVELAANPPPPPPPQPPYIGFKYIGYIGPKNGRIAVFEDGTELLLAAVGETVREQFKVVDIRYDSVVMGYTRKEFQGQSKELPMARK